MQSTLRNLWRQRVLVGALTIADLKTQSRHLVLGYLWWLLDPLLMTLIYSVVLWLILRWGRHHQPYPLFLLCGLMSWKAITGSLSQAVAAVSRSEGLITSYAFPKAAIPVSVVLLNHAMFLVALVPLIGAAVVYRLGAPGMLPPLGPSLVLLPAIVLMQLLLTLGGALLFSSVGVSFPDLGNILRHGLQLLWYLSPGLYALSDLSPGYGGLATLDLRHARSWLALNPAAHLMESYRSLLLSGAWPDADGMAYAALWGAAVTFLGLAVFRRQERHFCKYL